RSPERSRERRGELDRLGHLERAPHEAVAERPSRHERHGEPWPVRRLALVEERDEAVELPDLGEEPPLPVEPARGGPARRVEELERDLAPVGGPRAGDGDAPAAPDHREDVVAPEALHGRSLVGSPAARPQAWKS